MAVCRSFTRLSPKLLDRRSCSRTFLTSRYFATTCPPIPPSPQARKAPKYDTRRTLSTSANRCNTEQQAPSAYTYMQSRVTNGDKNLVDVKKVLVIGSGGLVRISYSCSCLESCGIVGLVYDGSNSEAFLEHWAGGRI